MGLFSVINKGIQAMIDEVKTPVSFKVGEKFEAYVRDYLFIDRYYDILERTHSYRTNKDFVEPSLKPNFRFRDKRTNKEFYVEAKFRSGYYDNKIAWCTEQEYARYLHYNREIPVFLILGVGNPKYPEFLSLVPITKARYTGLFLPYAKKFEISLDEPVSSKYLWSI